MSQKLHILFAVQFPMHGFRVEASIYGFSPVMEFRSDELLFSTEPCMFISIFLIAKLVNFGNKLSSSLGKSTKCSYEASCVSCSHRMHCGIVRCIRIGP